MEKQKIKIKNILMDIDDKERSKIITQKMERIINEQIRKTPTNSKQG